MGIIDRGILGGFSGKIGNVVGARWRGKDIMRVVPRKSSKEPTIAQLEQRAKFTAATKFLNPIKPVLNVYYGVPQGDKSRLNMALSYHIKEAISGVYPSYTIDYSKVMFAKGNLLGLTGETLVLTVNELTISWENNSSQSNALATDELLVLIYNQNTDTIEIIESAVTRADAILVRPMLNLVPGQVLSVWAAFHRKADKLVSTSQYLGTVTL